MSACRRDVADRLCSRRAAWPSSSKTPSDNGPHRSRSLPRSAAKKSRCGHRHYRRCRAAGGRRRVAADLAQVAQIDATGLKADLQVERRTLVLILGGRIAEPELPACAIEHQWRHLIPAVPASRAERSPSSGAARTCARPQARVQSVGGPHSCGLDKLAVLPTFNLTCPATAVFQVDPARQFTSTITTTGSVGIGAHRAPAQRSQAPARGDRRAAKARGASRPWHRL